MLNIMMNQKRGLNRFSKLPDDGDPWAPNNLLTPEQKKNTSWTPVGQATDKKFRPQPTKKVQVGKDQEKAQSERDSHSKNRGGKKPNKQSGTYTMKHIVSRMSSYFPNRWPLSYLNLIKNMKTYIRRQQHKTF